MVSFVDRLDSLLGTCSIKLSDYFYQCISVIDDTKIQYRNRTLGIYMNKEHFSKLSTVINNEITRKTSNQYQEEIPQQR